MIARIVGVALKAPFFVILAVLIVAGAGLFCYSVLDIEAYPNPVPPLVEIITQPDGSSAEEVERQVTIPLEVGLAGMPGLDHIRSQSLFGLSDVKCYFKWGVRYDDARQEVINRLQFTPLPNNVQAQLSPWNAIGEVFRYQVVGKGYTLEELNTAEQWILERQFKQVPGVIGVVSFGGLTREYHVNIDPYRLRGEGLTLGQVLTALSSSNQNVGGQRLEIGEQAFNVRGIGLLKNVHDIENIVINAAKGTPIRMRDVAQVEIGPAPRLGVVGRDDNPDIVQGTVLMRYGGETAATLEGIHAKIADIERNRLLPPGMHVEPFYDRGKLVELTTHTVIENLLVGMLLVSIVLFLFLGNWRAALITSINIPLALLIAFCGMVASGTPANLISLGAVDFGIVVDSTVIMMENIFSHLGSHDRGTMRERIALAAREVGGPMLFSTLVIGVAFLPLFTMTGVSGVIFAPMAHTYAFAIGGALLLALTLTPVAALKMMPVEAEEKDTVVMRAFVNAYTPVAKWLMHRRPLAVGISAALVLACGALFPLLGGEFMPKLEEGNFWVRATFPTSISLSESSRYVGRIRDVLRGCPASGECTEQNRKYPEVLTVISQLGRPDDGTDVSGFFNIELFAPLKPFSDWPAGVNKEKLTEQLSKELQEAFPGVVFNFSQMISDNVEEALSGVKGENSIKVIGPDLKTIEQKGEEIANVVEAVPGVKDIGMLNTLGQPSVHIIIDRLACARYGINTGDVDAVIQAAVGGQAVTQVYEGEKHFDLVVRWLESYRNNVDALRRITVASPDGTAVPLGQLATLKEEDGASIIYREDGSRYVPIKFSVRGRDLQSTIAQAQHDIQSKVKALPYDTHLAWAGQINQLHDAMGRLAIIIPITLLAIVLLVFLAVGTWTDTLVVISSIPIACTGGLAMLLFSRINFSVSAAMGFVSIFGIAVQDAILVVSYFKRLYIVERKSLEEAAYEAGERRFRPQLMTTLVATLGLLPAAISTGIGSQTQKPLAVVVIGGSLILALTSRLLKPPVLVMAHQLRERVLIARGRRPSEVRDEFARE